MASVKSFVWYSPSMFEEGGYEIPETWDDLLALTEQIAKDHEGEDVKPWCAGIESGGATGWPATDWVEDLVLRSAGADVYDQWVTHRFRSTIPQSLRQPKRSARSKDDRYVKWYWRCPFVATTSFNDGGLPTGMPVLHTAWLRSTRFSSLRHRCFRERRRVRVLPAGHDC